MEGDKQMIASNPTEISDLPSNVLDTIVCRLELPDAVRTASVAKDWRNCWKVKREINFSWEFYDQFIRGTDDRIDDVVNSVLTRHTGPIDKFEIHFPGGFLYNVPIDISEGIRSLSTKDVKELVILGDTHRSYIHLPAELYKFSKLSKLNLKCCILNDQAPEFDGYPDLGWLRFYDVCVSENVLNVLISRSPSLYHLDLDFWVDGSPLEIHHAASENLTTLLYKCKGGCRRPLRLTGPFPNLVRATFQTELKLVGRPSSVSKLDYFCSLIHKVKHLFLDPPALNSVVPEVIPASLSRPLPYLNRLDLYAFDIESERMLGLTFCLIRSSPELKAFTVFIDRQFNEDINHEAAREVLIVQGSPFSNIEALSFDNVTCSDEIELDFIKGIIQLCPNLKNFFLRVSRRLNREREKQVYHAMQAIQLPEGASFEFQWFDWRHPY